MDYRYPRQSEAPRQAMPDPICRKARLKALSLLEYMDRTEAQLREKLLQKEFPPEAVEDAVGYVKSFGYLDDARYVRCYIECRQGQKSRRILEQELQFKKGVSPELIRQVYEELEPADEQILIRKVLRKKHYDPSDADDKVRQKMMAALVRKGFSMKDIRSVMEEDPAMWSV